jgi:uncharacterized protein (TIRG00374 family)
MERTDHVRLRITRHQAIIAGTLAVTALAVVAAFHDVPAVGRALRDFNWTLLPPALALSSLMHLLRFARWHIYAGRAAAGLLGAGESLLIYGAGMGTHLTPGRAGEAVRCVFLRRATNTPLSRSAPILLVERLTDGVGLLGLALPGALLLGLGGPGTLVVLTGLLLVVSICASRRAHAAILALSGHTPLLRRHHAAIEEAVEELRGMLTPRLLLAGVLLSIASVALEVGTFALVLKGVGVELNPETLMRAAFVLPAAMLASAVFIIPGNLGVAEGGLATLTRVTLSASAAAAAGAAILVRLCTLWLGLLVGWLALALATRRWGGAPREA